MGSSHERDTPVHIEIDVDLVEYVIVEVPALSSLDRVATALAEVVRSRAIRILDVVTVVKAGDGSVEVLEVDDVDTLRALGDVGGYFGGFLSSRDLILAAHAVAPDSTAIVLLAEDRWAKPLSGAARAAGGRVLGGERVPRSRMYPALADASGFADPTAPDDEGEHHATHDAIT
jgi:hypothetical protein